MLLAFVIAAVAVGFTGARFNLAPAPPVVRSSLPPKPASYLGVYESGAPPSYQPIEQFADAAGRQPNLILYYSGWAQPFATSFAKMVYKHGLIPFVQIDPTFASVSAIADGSYDEYLDTYAASVRDFGHQVVIGFGHEMNSTAYPWGYGKVAPSTFVAAWRHIVTVFRSQGADNVTWLWTLEVDGQKTASNGEAWWPGANYVTWIGIDGYYMNPSDTFNHVFLRTIEQVRAFNKPVLLSETAVKRSADQFSGIENLFKGVVNYRLLGLVWFDKNQLQMVEKRDWRIEGDRVAEGAFHLGVSGLRLVATRSP
jgi:hypothetical protein